MNLAPREKVTILIGAIIVVLVLGWRFAQGGGGDSESGIGYALERLETHQRLERDVIRLSEDMGLDVPTVVMSDQEAAIRKDLGETVGRSGMGLQSVRAIETNARARGAAVPVMFRLDMNGTFEGLMKLIHAFEHGSKPYLIRDLTVNAAGGEAGAVAAARAAGRGGNRPEGKVSVSMKVQAYLFPEVKLAASEEASHDEASEGAKPPEKRETVDNHRFSKDASEEDSITTAPGAMDAATSDTLTTDTTPLGTNDAPATPSRKSGGDG